MKMFKKILKRFSGIKAFKSCWYLKKKKKNFYLSKYRRIHNNYICFNSLKLPFSRKSNNSRMGKGKGKLKNWYINIFSGKIIFFLKRWSSFLSIFALQLLKMYIPGRSILLTPILKKGQTFCVSASFII
jgi:ribosomal protein L16/L10AE